ncbi:helix-turn-helix transcriptional regulator [Kitasatospora sp. NPDC057015]|uniref:helix-turn-helix transcriptional regulator n=1 Tax=Kitasatospora sp. NPDC057015 TaxID=3346001 RepID=UPI003625CFDC
MDDTIRHPLAYARALRGWSQSDLAARLHRAAQAQPESLRSGADKAAVSKWERSRKEPNDESQLLIAEAFGVSPEDLATYDWPYWLPGQDQPVPLGAGSTIHALRTAQRAAMDPRRRTFMTFSALALAGLSAQWSALEPGRLATALNGSPVDNELIDWLQDSSTKLAALPARQREHTAKLMDAQLGTVTDLLEHGSYSEATGRRLHQLAATLASTCGWHRFDEGHHYAAGKLWNAALTNAHAARDRDLGAGILSDFAYQSIWLAHPDAALAPLSQALIHTSHPTARAQLHLRRARAHAALGRASDCHQDLTASEAALMTDSPHPSPTWAKWMSTADLAVDSGQCLLDLGHTRAALARIDEGITLLPATRDKTRGIFLTYEARSLLRPCPTWWWSRCMGHGEC